MIKLTIVDNEYYTAWCYPAQRLVEHQWHKYCYGETLREIMNKSADAFEEHKCFKWLSDDRQFCGAMHTDDVIWGKEKWAPRMFEAGWKYHAMVLPKTIIGSMGITDMVNWYKKMGVKTKIFRTTEKARSWLESRGTLDIGFMSEEE
jgi:hypothetical protein